MGTGRGLQFISILICLLCAPAGASAKTLRVYLPGAPVNLDWGGLATLIEAPVILNLNEGLFGYRFPGQILEPALAESVQKSKDLTEYTFTLRKDAKWSDGRAIRAADFRDAWLRVLSPQSVSIYSYYLFDIENAREYSQKEIVDAGKVGITVVDDLTLKVKLRRPRSAWEVTTAFWPLFPVRMDQIERFGANWWRPGALLSSGPFVLDSMEAGKSVILKRNRFHPATDSDITAIEFKIEPAGDAVKGFKEGRYEFLWGLPRTAFERKIPARQLEEIPLLRVFFLAMNMSKYPTQNRSFRMALLKTISKSGLIPPGNPDLTPVSTLIPSPLPGSAIPIGLKHDRAEAGKDLAKSGVLVRPGLRVRILTNLTEPFFSIGRNLESQISGGLGLNVELAALPGLEYTAYMNLGEYDLALITWTAKIPSPEDFLLPYSGEAVHNRLNYRNAVFDQWLFDSMGATDSRSLEKSLRMAQTVFLIDEAVGTPLFTEKALVARSGTIKNVYFNHMGIPILKSAKH